MEFTQAIKLTKKIDLLLSKNNYKEIKYAKHEIKNFKYIITTIKNIKLINIGLKELYNEGYNYIELEKNIRSYIGKKKRIKKRIGEMNYKNLWFATYTINDKSMNKDHIRKLKELNKENKYIINVDYGKEKERKHYHGIIESDKEPKTWNYGFCKFIKIENINQEALAKYINKITNHAIKDTAEKIIYSRKKSLIKKYNK